MLHCYVHVNIHPVASDDNQVCANEYKFKCVNGHTCMASTWLLMKDVEGKYQACWNTSQWARFCCRTSSIIASIWSCDVQQILHNALELSNQQPSHWITERLPDLDACPGMNQNFIGDYACTTCVTQNTQSLLHCSARLLQLKRRNRPYKWVHWNSWKHLQNENHSCCSRFVLVTLCIPYSIPLYPQTHSQNWEYAHDKLHNDVPIVEAIHDWKETTIGKFRESK